MNEIYMYKDFFSVIRKTVQIRYLIKKIWGLTGFSRNFYIDLSIWTLKVTNM